MIIKKVGSFQISLPKKRKKPNTCHFPHTTFNSSAPIYEAPKVSFLTADWEEEKISYGNTLLDNLHNFYCDLVRGEITYDSLESLKKTINLEKKKDSSQALEEIINLIEIRVQVELAKIEKALNNK